MNNELMSANTLSINEDQRRLKDLTISVITRALGMFGEEIRSNDFNVCKRKKSACTQLVLLRYIGQRF